MDKEVVNILDEIAKEAVENDWSDAEWTKQIKSRLAAKGKEYRYWVYASQAENTDGGEWVFDLIWLTYSGDDLLEVELALESEWNTQGIHDDFQKLLLARALLRVMIFQARDLKEQRKIVSDLKRQIDHFARSQIGDQYLLSCWVIEEKRFVHQSYFYQKDNA